MFSGSGFTSNHSQPEIQIKQWPRYPKIPFSQVLPKASPQGKLLSCGTRDAAYEARAREISCVLNPSFPAIDLLERLLQFDPAKRLTAAEALQHPYFTSTNPGAIALAPATTMPYMSGTPTYAYGQQPTYPQGTMPPPQQQQQQPPQQQAAYGQQPQPYAGYSR
jgi:negative regulator of the PHO system